MAPVRYDLAVAAWRDSDTITILSCAGKPIAYFPLDFVFAGGHPEWTYVISAIQQVTENAVGAEWRLEDSDGNPVVSSDRPESGRYVYRVQGALT